MKRGGQWVKYGGELGLQLPYAQPVKHLLVS